MPTVAGNEKIWILAGQSNARGSNHIPAELPAGYELPRDDVPTWQFDGKTGYRSCGAESLRAPYGLVGVEPYVMIDLVANGEPVALAKVVESGTSLAADWDPAVEDGLYSEMVRAATTLDAIIGAGIAGLIWIQGEEDAGSATWSDAYEANLEAFIGSVRDDLAVADLPVYLVRLRAESPYPYAATVRAAQEEVIADDDDVYLIDSDSAGIQADGIHYSDAGYQALGQAIAAAIAEG